MSPRQEMWMKTGHPLTCPSMDQQLLARAEKLWGSKLAPRSKQPTFFITPQGQKEGQSFVDKVAVDASWCSKMRIAVLYKKDVSKLCSPMGGNTFRLPICHASCTPIFEAFILLHFARELSKEYQEHLVENQVCTTFKRWIRQAKEKSRSTSGILTNILL